MHALTKFVVVKSILPLEFGAWKTAVQDCTKVNHNGISCVV